MFAWLGGLARMFVGVGWLSRGIIYPPTALLCAWLGFGISWWTIPFALIPALTLWLGWTKWEDPLFMGARYGLPPLVLSGVYGYLTGDYTPILWGASSVLVGISYNVIQLKATWISKLSSKLDSSRVAEFVAGSVILGGVSLLGG